MAACAKVTIESLSTPFPAGITAIGSGGSPGTRRGKHRGDPDPISHPHLLRCQLFLPAKQSAIRGADQANGDTDCVYVHDPPTSGPPGQVARSILRSGCRPNPRCRGHRSDNSDDPVMRLPGLAAEPPKKTHYVLSLRQSALPSESPFGWVGALGNATSDVGWVDGLPIRLGRGEAFELERPLGIGPAIHDAGDIRQWARSVQYGKQLMVLALANGVAF
jgi:hypothetical protein